MTGDQVRVAASATWVDPDDGVRLPADAVLRLCHRCRAAAGLSHRGRCWTRTDPRP